MRTDIQIEQSRTKINALKFEIKWKQLRVV